MADHLFELAKRLKRGPLLPQGSGRTLSANEGAPARLLPHRPPFLLLDAVMTIDESARRLRATRHIAASDPVFRGHFPELPIYPGVLLVEMMGQAALATLPLAQPEQPAAVARFTRIRDAAFLAPVLPGDDVDVHAEALDDGLVVTALGQVWKGDVLCAYAISEAYIDE